MRPTILTIGHSTRPIEEFLDLLTAHEVEQVADVRTIPKSRRNPQFNTEDLARVLQRRHIRYVHLPKLGGLLHPAAGFDKHRMEERELPRICGLYADARLRA